MNDVSLFEISSKNEEMPSPLEWREQDLGPLMR